MEFAPSDRARDFVERLTAFMDERVYPAEAIYAEQLRAGGSPHFHPPIMEELCAAR
jgi:acyl-CoA dehydrogenase